MRTGHVRKGNGKEIAQRRSAMSSMQLIVSGLGLFGHIAVPGRKIVDGPDKHNLMLACGDDCKTIFVLDKPLEPPMLSLAGRDTLTVSRIGVQDRFAGTYGVKSDGHVFNIKFWVFHREEQHPNTEFTGLFDTHRRQGHIAPVYMSVHPVLANMVFMERGFVWSKDFFGREYTLTIKPNCSYQFYVVGSWPITTSLSHAKELRLRANVIPPGEFHVDIQEPLVVARRGDNRYGMVLSQVLDSAGVTLASGSQ